MEYLGVFSDILTNNNSTLVKGIEMKESTNRPAWTQTIVQGMKNGLYAFKHKIIKRSNCSAELVENFDWTADANAVPSE